MTGDSLLSLPHCFRRSLWPLWDRRTTWAILALLTLIGGLYLWQASEIAATQRHIRELKEEHERWRRKNAQLWKEVTGLTPVTVLSERAQALGFSMPQGEMYLPLSMEDTSTASRGIADD